ncbi:MAG TPA: hypothetical protein VLT45_16060 [Kofleriaceae bacterium]|nr:hypothetical protein [Kofleriaceae bacterium]
MPSRVVRYLAPHVAIVLGLLGLAAGAPGTVALGFILGGHLVAPVWAAKAPREDRMRAALLGPILLIAVELLVLVIAWLVLAGGNPEDTWISFYLLIIAAIVLALYAVYCVIAYSIVVRRER